jgi:hypothetical protein
VRAGGKLEPDDLPGPQPEVANNEPKVDPPARVHGAAIVTPRCAIRRASR